MPITKLTTLGDFPTFLAVKSLQSTFWTEFSQMIRILVVDDQRVIRQGLKALLDPEPDFEVVGDADNGQTAIEQVAALGPDVVLLDIRMPVMDGVAATRIIHQDSNTKVLVLSGSDDEESLAQALQAGAMGYLLKDTPAEEIANAIRSVHRGYTQMGPGLFEKLVSRVPVTTPAPIPEPTPETPPWQPKVSMPPELDLLGLLKGFDPLALAEAVRTAAAQHSLSSFFTQVRDSLQQEPTNVAALYLAGALGHRKQRKKLEALEALKQGFQQGLRQGIPFKDLLLFYREGMLLNPEEVFTWLSAKSDWQSDDQAWDFLLPEAAQAFGTGSQHYRSLLVLRQVKAAAKLSEDCLLLAPQLEALEQGFKQLTAVSLPTKGKGLA